MKVASQTGRRSLSEMRSTSMDEDRPTPIYPDREEPGNVLFCGVCGENATNPMEMSYEGVKQSRMCSLAVQFAERLMLSLARKNR